MLVLMLLKIIKIMKTIKIQKIVVEPVFELSADVPIVPCDEQIETSLVQSNAEQMLDLC